MAVEILRDGRSQTIPATLDAQKSDATTRTWRSRRHRCARLWHDGAVAHAGDCPSELELTGRKEGVVIRDVSPDGAAAAAGLQPGDVIAQVNGKAVTSASELKTALGQSTGRPALLLVARKGGDIFVTLGGAK